MFVLFEYLWFWKNNGCIIVDVESYECEIGFQLDEVVGEIQ